MTECLSQWIFGLTAMALFCAAALALTPESRVRRIVQLACTLAMAIALLSPFARLDMDSYARSLARYRETLIAAENGGRNNAQRLSRTIIEEECAAYISDKGNELGLAPFAIRVQAKWGDAFWYPYEVWLTTPWSEKLSRWIEGELGVPRERMHWSNENAEDG